jgi:hypothetical protein
VRITGLHIYICNTTQLVQLQNRGLGLPAALAASVENEVVHPTHGIVAVIAIVIHVNSLLKHQFNGSRIAERRLNVSSRVVAEEDGTGDCEPTTVVEELSVDVDRERQTMVGASYPFVPR